MVVSLLILGFTFVSNVVISCASGMPCVAGVMSSYLEIGLIEKLDFDFKSAMSTQATLPQSATGIDFSLFNDFLKTVGVYAFALALIALLLLEIKELHYLKLIYEQKSHS